MNDRFFKIGMAIYAALGVVCVIGFSASIYAAQCYARPSCRAELDFMAAQRQIADDAAYNARRAELERGQ